MRSGTGPRAAARLACALAALALALAPVPAALADEAAAQGGDAQAAAADETAAEPDWSYYGDDDLPSVSCKEAVVVTEDGTVLFSRQGTTSMPMASVTKMMTAVVALESGVPLDTVVTATESVWTVYGQTVGIAPGEQATLGDLLRAMLVYSGNDAAVCVAEGVAGSVPAFVDLMNAKAAELGMWGTSYANPHGLDADGHYSTPVDLVTLARYAMQIPAFASIVGSSGVTVVLGGEEATFASTDELLNAYPGMRGIKTGYTDAAGRTFVGAATRGGQTVYVCVLGCSSNEERWADVAALLDWAFAHADQTTLDVGAQALGGSLCYVDRFGWSVAASTDLAASLRADPATGEAADAQAELTWLATTGFADANDQVAQVAWYDGDGLVAARSATTGAPFSSGAYFGPLVSALFGDVS